MTELILIAIFVLLLAIGTAANQRWTPPLAIIGILLLVAFTPGPAPEVVDLVTVGAFR